MPTFQLKESSCARWDELHAWIGAKPDKNKYFASSQGRLHGFVIAWWNSEFPWPTHYLHDFVAFFGSKEELSLQEQNAEWQEFGDETAKENPRQYQRLSKAHEVIAELRRIFQTERIGLVFWVHPEADYQPIEKCLLITGEQFPGSPRL